jgi:hypothetical protein
MENQSISLGNYIQEKYVGYYRSKCLKNTENDLLMLRVIMGYKIADLPLKSITKGGY